MGDQGLEPGADDISENSYQIISYKGPELPAGYLNAVRAPFINQLRSGNELFKLIDHETYFKVYSPYVELLIKRPHAIVRLAELSDHTVLGWALYEKNCLHFVWVKNEVRRQGIAKSLLPEGIEWFSHITNRGMSIWAKPGYEHLRFNPFV